MHIDSNEDEETIFGWFFEAFQKGIRSFRVHHVGGINDENFVTALKRLKIED